MMTEGPGFYLQQKQNIFTGQNVQTGSTAHTVCTRRFKADPGGGAKVTAHLHLCVL
jgi:hypothetical protein